MQYGQVCNRRIHRELREDGRGTPNLAKKDQGQPHGFSSVQFSRSVVSDSLQPHESQHAGPPCPSPTPRVHSDSRPSNQGCHPAISSSVVPFSSCPQSLPASEYFPMSQFFADRKSTRLNSSHHSISYAVFCLKKKKKRKGKVLAK